MPSFVLHHGEPLKGDVDLGAAVAATPETASTKGIFFVDLLAMLPPRDREALATTLNAPPRLGRYLPFTSYPVRDLLRLIDAAARHRFATLAPREGYRRLGRTGFATFCETTMGKVMMSVIGDPMAAAKKYPEAYRLVTNAPPVTTVEIGKAHARMTFERYVGVCEYDLGFMEAAVLHFGCTPTLTVDHGPDALVVDVRW
jgi:uncharacterized protein (TIGR02265 family)